MGRLLIVGRLAARDLRRRPAEAALLLLAITAATTTLTLGLVLHGVITEPYQSTREATAGPDVVASVAPPPVGGQPADLAGLKALADAPGVLGHTGPYPYTQAAVEANGVTATAWTQGRDTSAAPVDQPKLTEGSWVRDGGAVIEASFATALGIGAGDRITLGGRSFHVAGVAVTAASTPYPKVCFAPCWFGVAADAAERNAANRSVNGPVRSQAGPPPNAFRPGLAYRGGCPQPWHTGAVPCLRCVPEAGRPGRSPGVRQRAPPGQHDRAIAGAVAGRPRRARQAV